MTSVSSAFRLAVRRLPATPEASAQRGPPPARPAERRAARRAARLPRVSRPRSRSAEAERIFIALRGFVLELLLVGASGGDGRGVPPRGVLDGRGVDARRHVVAGQAGRAGSRA